MAPQQQQHGEENSSECVQTNDSQQADPYLSSSSQSQQELHVWPESSYFQALSYAYMNHILNKGQQQFRDGKHLELEDLYAVPPDMEAGQLGIRFWQHYRKHHSLVRALWKIARGYYFAAAAWEALYIVARVALPMALRRLLIAIETAQEGESIVRDALAPVIVMAVAGFLVALCQGRSVFLSTQAGIAVRAVLTSIIYEHALQLTPKGRIGLTTGTVTNMVATDSQKLYDVLVEGQNLWSCPVLIIIVAVLLWIYIGPELVLGIVVLILFLPIIKVIVGNMLSIRKQRSKLTDKRIQMISSMLQGILVTKLNHYEKMVETSVMAVRDQEMNLLSRELRMWGLVLTTAVSSPILAFGMAITFFVLSSNNNILRPSDAFSALLFFSILRFPVNLAARLVGKAAQAMDSVRRIDLFLQREARSPDSASQEADGTEADSDDNSLLRVQNGHFVVQPDDPIMPAPSQVRTDESGKKRQKQQDPDLEQEQPTADRLQPFYLSNIDLTVKKGQRWQVHILKALLGELPSDDSIQVHGTLSYVSQEPFIMNASFRENICFGNVYEKLRYEQVIDATDLRADIARLGPSGDLSQIGERGVTLSGGQKQRVALARAVYANPSLALLDDCFSALDPNTARRVFDSLFQAESGILRQSGTILVTHALHFLPQADLILLLEHGSPAFMGTFQELRELESKSDSIEASMVQLIQDGSQEQISHLHHNGVTERDGVIMTVEEREYGKAGYGVWVEWGKNAGGWSFFISQTAFLCLDRGIYVASDWWIALWSQGWEDGVTIFGMEFPPQTDGNEAQVQYICIYLSIITLSVLATLIRSLWAMSAGARCAKQMFRVMAERVLHAPMSFFQTTPMGRIVNRFTYDVEVMDVELSVAMTGLMMSSSWLLSSIVVMAVVLPWILIPLAPVTVIYIFTQSYYRMSGPDLQRLDAISRSPIQASLAEGLDGAYIIRAYRKEVQFASSFRHLVNRNSAAMMNFLAGQRWLGFRIEIMGASITTACSIIIILANDMLNINAGMVGLLLQWSIVFTSALNFFFLRLTDSEARLTSIERIHRTSQLKSEAAWGTDSSVIKLEESWPRHGELEFRDVCMRYRNDLPLALDSVSFRLTGKSRCGVVGRTGAGKTSLTASIFRIAEIESGQILLDGVDLAKLGLTDVRGRPHGLRIIPQDPVLYAGTLRDCMDPFKQCEDDEIILEALKAVKHQGALERGISALNDSIEEGGSNLSAGERQLLCLARAIVEKPRVLILDEATASIDSSTDAFIQEMLRTRFNDTTLLTIAHRLHTIMDYDTVLVMENGRVSQFGPPKQLLQDRDGIFASLVDSSGPETAKELRAIAEKH